MRSNHQADGADASSALLVDLLHPHPTSTDLPPHHTGFASFVPVPQYGANTFTPRPGDDPADEDDADVPSGVDEDELDSDELDDDRLAGTEDA